MEKLTMSILSAADAGVSAKKCYVSMSVNERNAITSCKYMAFLL